MPSCPKPFSFALIFGLLAGASVCCADDLNFNRDIRPLLSEACFHCHGPDRATRESGLRLDQEESAMTVIAPGDVEGSDLVQRISSTDADVQMPPPDSGKTLSKQQRDLLKRWVAEGAVFDRHWSFIPPQQVSPPARNAADDFSSNPIDRFVLHRMHKAGLSPSPKADREELIRRVCFDLTGLPPTPGQVDTFQHNQSPDAFATLIDSLMASPRYGEHMAVPWLEAARYADTDGYQNDRYRYQHVWRDWVIDALNQNMPYDQFITEQIAGDMLPNATLRQQIASGFGRNHRINSEDGSIPEEWRIANVVDRVDTFGTVFLGLTIECSRCHDHKYDPVSQQEYYQLFSYFNNVAEWGVGPNNGNSPPFIEVPESWPLLSPDQDRLIPPDPVKLTNARKTKGNGLRRPQAGPPSTVMVMHELDRPRETFVLLRGQYNMPDKSNPLSPAVPAAFDSRDSTTPTPSNRLELARWLIAPDHPLTARVAVNRIWQQFFGRGLVATSENFGSQGTPPSHPELLDYLAIELIRSDWDLRRIQRLILDSSTYQQSSAATTKKIQADPKNIYLSRGPRIRLPGFALRDQALSISGLLTNQIGGPSAKPYMPPKIWSSISNNKYEQDAGQDLYRRSIYTYWRRTIPPPTMMNFNAAAREVCIVRTQRTNTPLQALTLMNNKLFVEAARGLAQRMILESSGSDASSQIKLGFQLACGRIPTAPEKEILTQSHEKFLQQFQSQPSAAKELLAIGDSKRNASIAPIQHAAMTMTASLLMNLDETITKE
ncbi:PSD1 and planctomycete cytochrome C domain-containing protein [Planctomycetes bacterium K23_9]|uniref:Planctomycete cytochrome C n=1 Tax=Stieleria marina TaxID=1930275 RepID=A0A517NPU2_9BACT|nr:Planctomycete cytochrome C [Planctomycetes bacterium K23_9]